MDIQLLGTAAAEGFPGLFCNCVTCQAARLAGGVNIRARSSALVGQRVLIDFSPDMLWNQARFSLQLGDVTDLFITHPHIDHLAASELVLRSLGDYCADTVAPQLCIHCSADSEQEICRAVQYDLGRRPSFLRFNRLEAFQPVQVGALTVTPLPAQHDPHSLCYLFLLEEQGVHFLYGHDSATFPEDTFLYLRNHYLQGILLDCTFGTVTHSCKTHMNLSQCSAVRERLQDASSIDGNTQCYLTHFSHDCGMLQTELEHCAAKTGFRVAYDGLRIQL